MSVEVITMIASAATIIVALVSGFGWMIGRMDARFAAQDARFASQDEKWDARFASQDARWDARFAAQDEKWDARFAELSRDLVEVKVAVGRLEGAPRHLHPLR